MNRKSVRIAAATAMAAISLGVAIPAANAVEAHRNTASVSTLAISEAQLAALKTANPRSATNGEASISAAELAALTAAANAGEGQQFGGKIDAIIALLKKSPGLFKAAVNAAKKGAGAFKDWVDGLSDWNPVKWTLQALPGEAMIELVRYLSGM
ncbi:hypothetical protein [Streptomyces sp. UNOB3_S3]|uniref:hypothetical protein n=1 Tax=Streptomyces sp. UNOB3_S3 TaxID=2871682 RepID=UPI001E4E3969|nr:hypothetical protein [Streptomyces sp. UNOB3_S3]MCC3774181.1 hypothetical protein [Streptomyces sp. UNOB3_S3]